jgi:uncharacterized coiled-coil DUF342 family protein
MEHDVLDAWQSRVKTLCEEVREDIHTLIHHCESGPFNRDVIKLNQSLKDYRADDQDTIDGLRGEVEILSGKFLAVSKERDQLRDKLTNIENTVRNLNC